MRTMKLFGRVGLGALALAAACAQDPTAPAVKNPDAPAPSLSRGLAPTGGMFQNGDPVVDLGTSTQTGRSGYMVTSGRHTVR